MKNNKLLGVSGILGFLVGAFIGYLYRPPAFLIGQLPFKHVISRGATLKGLEQIYIPLAERSFNYLVVGGITGAVLGLAAVLLSQRKSN
jgi:hypothetical protein